MKNTNLIAVILLLVGLGAGFFGGMQYQKSQVQTGTARGNRQGQFGNRTGANGARPVTGDIIAADDKSITVKMNDGSSKIVILSTNTSITKSDPGLKTDLKVGQRVAAFGMDNSDGSMTAQSVQLNPMFRMGNQPTGTQSGSTKQ